MSENKSLSFGVDLGGTKIEGVVYDSGKPIASSIRKRVPTEQEGGYEHILGNIKSLIQELSVLAGVKPEEVGLAHPGVLDPQTLLIRNSNTQCLNNRPLKRDLEKLLSLPCQLANDANCFTLAEACLGAAQDADLVFGVIMGTGVGGGIVHKGQVIYGAQGIAGEWGHNTLTDNTEPCYCGKKGCVEATISGPALEKFYSKQSGLTKSLSEIVSEARGSDNNLAKSVVNQLVQNFAKAISVVINILDPQVIVLGGGLSKIDELYSQSPEEVLKYIMHDKLNTRIVRNQLGDSAGVFGAAMLCRAKRIS